ncbi:MAG TPA: alpha-galactosidase [Acidobacteriaceae bacterium]|nr:alpha-galactosidase [Acidobacteriaceae bacterium]
MGWNDWASYQCDHTAQTIFENVQALVRTGLAARGYKIVNIDDCWTQKARDCQGDLQADPQRFPHGMKPVVQAVHALGLKLGIYGDAGPETCGGFAGSGEPDSGGNAHFLEDASSHGDCLCLTGSESQGLTVQACAENLETRIWSLHNARIRP